MEEPNANRQQSVDALNALNALFHTFAVFDALLCCSVMKVPVVSVGSCKRRVLATTILYYRQRILMWLLGEVDGIFDAPVRLPPCVV